MVTKTAAVHAAAWKQLFDEYLRRRAEFRREVFVPFDIEADYRRLVDGKPRADGVRSFLGLVVGVDRGGQAEALRQHGADVVGSDLRQIVFRRGRVMMRAGSDTIPSVLDSLGDLTRQTEGKRFAVFLDYDGTLTPIVARPELAVLSDAMRATVGNLAMRCPVAIISGRDRADVAELVGLESVYYAGSHGFDISGPERCRMQHEGGVAAAPALRAAEQQLRERLAGVTGAAVEGKEFAVAVHYRQVQEFQVPHVEQVVDGVAAEYPGLCVTGGKKILELRPRIEWDKGRAVLWLLRALRLDLAEVCPIYIGDDLTDEDAFEALADCGIGIVVRDDPRETAARYALDHPDDAGRFLEALRSLIDRRAR